MSVVDDVQQHLGQNEIQQISDQIGADPAATREAVQAAVPMMLGGVANASQQPGNAQAIEQAVQSHSGLLGSLGGLLGGAFPADGGGLLGRILGGHQATVQQGVQQASGLDSDQTKRLLLTLAPIVMAMLAKRHANSGQGNLDTTLQQEARQAQEHANRTAPHVGGLLGKILSHVETPRA